MSFSQCSTRRVFILCISENVSGWAPLVHPEGALYWVNKKHPDETHYKPIYTDTNMRDPDLRRRIEEALDGIKNLKENSPWALPADDWELALELGEDEETGEDICSYYFVHHSTSAKPIGCCVAGTGAQFPPIVCRAVLLWEYAGQLGCWGAVRRPFGNSQYVRIST